MMPQLGETVTEGTITRWMKGVGDAVERDEPLFEVSTDKVDSEVPSPAAGVLTEILVPEGETVEVGVRLAVIGDNAGATASSGAPAPRRRPRRRWRPPSQRHLHRPRHHRHQLRRLRRLRRRRHPPPRRRPLRPWRKPTAAADPCSFPRWSAGSWRKTGSARPRSPGPGTAVASLGMTRCESSRPAGRPSRPLRRPSRHRPLHHNRRRHRHLHLRQRHRRRRWSARRPRRW